MNRRPLANYADIEAQNHQRTPQDFVREWITHWSPTYAHMIWANGWYDVVALITARWAFLGALLVGNDEKDVGYDDAVQYSKVFLEKVQPLYGPLHNMTGDPKKTTGSDIFTMCRSKPLHGMTPAPVYFPDGDGVVTWWIGEDIAPEMHLRDDANGALHINVLMLRDELMASMILFAEHLEQGGAPALEKFRRAFWARFTPIGYPKPDWMQAGRARKLFTT